MWYSEMPYKFDEAVVRLAFFVTKLWGGAGSLTLDEFWG